MSTLFDVDQQINILEILPLEYNYS